MKKKIVLTFEFYRKWSKDTHDYFHKLWKNGDAFEAGVCLLPVIRLTTDSQPYTPLWSDIVFGYTELNKNASERLCAQHERNYK